MNREKYAITHAKNAVPRASGDEPAVVLDISYMGICSPRQRG